MVTPRDDSIRVILCRIGDFLENEDIQTETKLKNCASVEMRNGGGRRVVGVKVVIVRI